MSELIQLFSTNINIKKIRKLGKFLYSACERSDTMQTKKSPSIKSLRIWYA